MNGIPMVIARTQVNEFVVSTVRLPYACADREFETMVFPIGTHSEVDFAGYMTEADARIGHDLMVKKYS